jgi:hypothetical protein
MTEGTDEPRAERVEPLGAPTDPMRPTGPVGLGQASQEAKARMAAGARKVLAAFAIAIGVAVLLAVLAIVAITVAFD